MALIRLINPNSNADVTAGLAEAVAPFAIPGRIEIECETLAEGPFGIESQRDYEAVTLPLVARMHAAPADAFVIACYSDPGLALARTEIAAPVFGIQESAIATALVRGERFGVVAILDASIPRHMRAMRSMGVGARCAGERALNLSVAESGSDAVFGRLEATARALCEDDGADVVILGCAGMARHRQKLERAVRRPVIDPAQAAAGMAAATLLAASAG